MAIEAVVIFLLPVTPLNWFKSTDLILEKLKPLSLINEKSGNSEIKLSIISNDDTNKEKARNENLPL